MNRVLLLLGGIGIGAGIMYLLDPQGGNRRRAVLRDKALSAANKTGDVLGSKGRDLRNRAQGVIHETRSAMQSGKQLLPSGQRNDSAIH